MGAHLYHLNFIWKNFEQNRRTFFSTIHHHHPSVTTSGPWGLEPRGWKSHGYILIEPNTFSQKAWVLCAWVLITLNWELFFRPSIHHPPSTVRHNKRALRPGTPRLEIRRLHTERAKYIQKAWVLYTWVLITLNWEGFFFFRCFSFVPAFRTLSNWLL